MLALIDSQSANKSANLKFTSKYGDIEKKQKQRKNFQIPKKIPKFQNIGKVKNSKIAQN